MSFLLRPVTDRLASLWNPAPLQTDRAVSKQSAVSRMPANDFFAYSQNHIISDNLPLCTICEATLEKTDAGEISFYSELTGTIICPDEKILYAWLGNRAEVDMWKIRDLRGERTAVFYKLQKDGEWGYDTFNERELYTQLNKDYGVLWREVDQKTGWTTYKRFRTSIFGNTCEDVDFENLVYVANNLRLKGDSTPPHHNPTRHKSRLSGEKNLSCSLCRFTHISRSPMGSKFQ